MSLGQLKKQSFSITAVGALVVFTMTLAGCSDPKEAPVPRAVAPVDEVLDPIDSTAHFADLSGSESGSFGGDSGGSGGASGTGAASDGTSAGGKTIVHLGNPDFVEETHPGSETYPSSGTYANTIQSEETIVVEDVPEQRDYQNPEELQSTMRDIKIPQDVFSTTNFDLYGEYGTGAKMNESLYFTDASNDGLMQYLRDTLRRPEDRAFSASLHGVQILDIDRERGDHNLRFSLRGGPSDMTFQGRADGNGIIRYTSTGMDSGLRLDGICLDEYDHCHNLLIRVQQNAVEGLLTGFIVFRATPGSVVLEGYESEISGSPMDRWTTFILNTKRHRQLRDAGAATSNIVNRMQYFTFTTTTVLFGESRFEADMEVLRPNLCSELILVNGPLVKSFDTNRFTQPLSQPRTEFVSRNGMTQDDLGLFMGELQRATLVNNSGYGEVRVALNVANNVAEDLLHLTFERKHVQTNLDRVCYLHSVEGLCALDVRELEPMER